jgi:TRAP-type C4-dicarboxylate transport system permease small subunit
MKKVFVLLVTAFLYLLTSFPVLAAGEDVSKVQSFIQSVIQVLVTLAGLISAGFFVWGGVGYITSSGNPESLDRSKKTILYSAIGLAIVLGSYVLSNIVTQLATGSFGTN